MEGLLVGAIIGMVVMGLVIRSVIAAQKPPVIHNAPVANASANSSGSTGAGVPAGMKVPVQPLLFVAALAMAALLIGSVARGSSSVPVTVAAPKSVPVVVPSETSVPNPIQSAPRVEPVAAPDMSPLYAVLAVLVVVAIAVWGTIAVMALRGTIAVMALRRTRVAVSAVGAHEYTRVADGQYRLKCLEDRTLDKQKISVPGSVSIEQRQDVEQAAPGFDWERELPNKVFEVR
jgi:hypothetical protein